MKKLAILAVVAALGAGIVYSVSKEAIQHAALAQGGPGIGVPSGPGAGGKVPADFDTIASYAGGTPNSATGATLMLATINNITNSSPNVAFKLILCTHPPMRQTVVNTTSNTVTVYASGTDTINGTAGATGVTQTGPGKQEYICTVASPGGTWFK